MSRLGKLNRWSWAALILTLITAFALRYQGIGTPSLHPDEPTIGRWLSATVEDSYVKERVYAGGFFTLARPFHLASRALHTLGNRWSLYVGKTTHPGAPDIDTILFARHFNAWLGILTCAVLFVFTKRLTRSTGAGLCAAALLAVSQYHVEHCHYAESDIAMLFALTLALWLWAEFDRHRSLRRLLPACLVTGFAIGTKFNLAPLLPVAVYYALLTDLAPGKRSARLVKRVLLPVLALVTLVAGFAWACPAATRTEWFLAGLKQQGARVYGERIMNYGPVADVPWVAQISHLRQLVEYAGSLGITWLAALLVGVAALLRRPNRRAIPLLIGFPLLYLAYFIFASPWVRSQEFMVFLPPLAALAGLAVATIRGTAPSRARRALSLAATLIILVPAAIHSLRTAAVFGWPDMRLAAAAWLGRHAPYEASTAFEIYTMPATRGAFGRSVDIYKAEKTPGSKLRATSCDFLVRNNVMMGRGVIDPRTGDRFPEMQATLDELRLHSTSLARWAPLRQTRSAPTFYGMDIELLGLRPAPTPALPLDLSPFRPLTVIHDQAEVYGPHHGLLGPDVGYLVDRYPKRFAVGGPRPEEAPVYLVLTTRERDATVDVEGLGQTTSVRLAPYDLRVVPLRRARGLPALSSVGVIEVKARRVKHQVYIPCFARTALSLDDAVRMCVQLGYPERAASLLETDPAAEDVSPALRYLVAAATGDRAGASSLRDAAAALCTTLKEAHHLPPQQVSIKGVDGRMLDAFARLRLQPRNQARELHLAPAKEAMRAATAPYGATLHFPAYLSGVPAQLTFELSIASTNTSTTLQFLDQWGRPLGQATGGPDAARFMPVSLALRASQHEQVSLTLASTEPVTLSYRHMELTWQTRTALTGLRLELMAALARDLTLSGQPDEALALLDRHEDLQTVARLLPIRLEALRASGAVPTQAVREVADAVMSQFPRYGRAGLVEQGETSAMDAATGSGTPRFGRHLSLVDVTLKPDVMNCTLESLSWPAPAFRLLLVQRRGRRWHKVAHADVPAPGRLYEGEQVELTLPRPANDEDAPASLDDFGLAIESAVMWPSGLWPADPGREGVLPAADWPTP